MAHDSKDATRVLRHRQILVTRLREISGTQTWWRSLFQRSKISGKDLVAFTLQFATMVKAGIPLIHCLHILSMHANTSTFRQILMSIRQDIEKGSALADSFRKHPRVFPPSYISMVEAGEAGGMLGSVLPRLATYLENMMQVHNRIHTALAYPLTLLALAVLIFAALIIWGIPLFSSLFADLGQDLPWPTVVVLAVSQFLKNAYCRVRSLGNCPRLWHQVDL